MYEKVKKYLAEQVPTPKPPKQTTPKSALFQTVKAMSREKRASRFQRPQAGINIEKQNTLNAGTELPVKGNFVKALMEYSGRQRTPRGERSTGEHGQRPTATTRRRKSPRETSKSYPPMTPEEQATQGKRTDAAGRRRRGTNGT